MSALFGGILPIRRDGPRVAAGDRFAGRPPVQTCSRPASGPRHVTRQSSCNDRLGVTDRTPGPAGAVRQVGQDRGTSDGSATAGPREASRQGLDADLPASLPTGSVGDAVVARCTTALRLRRGSAPGRGRYLWRKQGDTAPSATPRVLRGRGFQPHGLSCRAPPSRTRLDPARAGSAAVHPLVGRRATA